VMAALSQDEVMRLGAGLVRLRHLPESRIEKLWGRLASNYAWDWRDEDDLVEFIRSTLRKGLRQEPTLTPVQKLAMLMLLLPTDRSEQISRDVLAALPRSAATDLTKELAHLLHYPNSHVHENVVGEFLESTAHRMSPPDLPNSARFLQHQSDSIADKDPVGCARFLKSIWMDEKDAVTRYQHASSAAPDKMALLLVEYLRSGPCKPYIRPAEKCAIFVHSLQQTNLEAADRIKAWLTNQKVVLPTVMQGVHRASVQREFLHRYYVEMARNTFPTN